MGGMRNLSEDPGCKNLLVDIPRVGGVDSTGAVDAFYLFFCKTTEKFNIKTDFLPFTPCVTLFTPNSRMVMKNMV